MGYTKKVMLGTIVLFSLIGGVFSLAGGLMLLFKKEMPHQVMLGFMSFAAGVLLAVGFGDLLPEAVEAGEKMGMGPGSVLLWSLIAVIAFFLFERSFVWFHHHHGPHEHKPDPVVPMVWFGDTLHNFIDGIVIAASFLVSVPLGIATTVAVAAHEIPQEIADFSLFLAKGLSKTRVVLINLSSSLATVVGAVGAFFFWDTLKAVHPYLLAFTGGMFIYIAASDLIPEMHHEHECETPGCVGIHTGIFLAAIVLTLSLKSLIE